MIGRWQCRHPIPIQDKIHGGLKAYARCNRCVNCILRRKALWTGRNTLEWLHCGQAGAFLTFTYSDDHLPHASYADIQTFNRNLRHLFKMRFYCVPDTGDKFGRFHWHMLHHNIDATDPEYLSAVKKHWHHGHCHIEPIIPERIGYTCGYVAKKLSGTNPGRQNGSLGLGTSHFLHSGRELALNNEPLETYPRLLKIGTKRYPIDATCRAALKQGFIESGGIPHPDLDRTLRPSDLDRTYHVLVNEKLGGSRADMATTDYFNGKTKSQTKIPQTKSYRSPKGRIPD